MLTRLSPASGLTAMLHTAEPASIARQQHQHHRFPSTTPPPPNYKVSDATVPLVYPVHRHSARSVTLEPGSKPLPLPRTERPKAELHWS